MRLDRSTGESDRHLTAEQFGGFVERGTSGDGSREERHLQECQQCREELNSMREALALFRESAAAFAEREFARKRPVSARTLVAARRGFSPGLAWAAAGLLVIAAALPVELARYARQSPEVTHTTGSAAPTHESDEALLEDINREVSASVPASMQALEDPTASASGMSSDAQTPTTRKN